VLTNKALRERLTDKYVKYGGNEEAIKTNSKSEAIQYIYNKFLTYDLP
jgi:predicted AAA+ superfamily ATPase